MTTVIIGDEINLMSSWRAFVGGPADDLVSITIGITRVSDLSVALATTSTGIQHISVGVYTYAWVTPPMLVAGDYLVLWSGVDSQGDNVTATEVLTATTPLSSEPWAPSLRDVGGCIPTRTVNTRLPGNDEYLGTFTVDTEPTAAQATDKINNAVNDVLNAVPSVTTALENAAKNAAMWRAAADLELAYPDRNADANYYAQLNDRAKYQWTLFIDAANAGNAGTGYAYPVWYSPDSPWWADRSDI